MEVKWLRRALRDLENQIEFIAEDNPEAAVRTGETIGRAVARLANFPELGRIGRVPSTRELVVAGTRFIVIYRTTDSVEILRLLHSSQRWPPLPGGRQ